MHEKQSFAKTQHSVPQFLLKNFTCTGKGQLHVFDKHLERQFLANVRKVAAENGLYDIKLPEGNFSAEGPLSSLEGSAARVIASLLREQNVRVLSNDDRVVMALFIGAQMMRVTNQVEIVSQITELIRGKFGTLPGMPSQEESVRDAKRIMINNIRFATDLLPHLLDKVWLLLKAHNDSSFYSSDNPVRLHNTHCNPHRGTLGVAVKGIEIYLPISADTTLALYCKSHEEGWLRFKAQQEIMRSLGDDVPHALADRIAVVGALVDGLLNGNPAPLSQAVTNFQNELQIVNSSRFVFSKTGDFGLVKEAIKRYPAFKRGPRLATSA